MKVRPRIRLRFSKNGRWCPPKANGHNILYPTPNAPTPTFYHDGAKTEIKALPRSCQEYETYSLYHDQAVFWTVDYDATAGKVENGKDFPDDESESSDSEEEGDDWRPLSFEEANENDLHMNFAGHRLPSRKLLHQRKSSAWTNQLLPDTYQKHQDDCTSRSRYGGLVGDLPLLIGLVAMTLPETGQYGVHAMMPWLIVNPGAGGSWRVLPPERVPRGIGCKSVVLGFEIWQLS